jgi:DNA-directed RNA polymerase subunit RPC12/RpoP
MRQVRCSFCGNVLQIAGAEADQRVGLVACRNCGNKTFVDREPETPATSPPRRRDRGPFRLSTLVWQARRELREPVDADRSSTWIITALISGSSLLLLLATGWLAPKSPGVGVTLLLFFGALAVSLPAVIGALWLAATLFRFDFGPAKDALAKFSTVHVVALTVGLTVGLSGSLVRSALAAGAVALLLFSELFELRFPTNVLAFSALVALEAVLLVIVLYSVHLLFSVVG